MSLISRKEPLVLLLGDVLFFIVALWLSLLLRNVEPPSYTLFLTHIAPFSILFVMWIVVFYIAGLYEKHTVILKNKLPNIIGITQLGNSALAVIFFYFVPFFGITPKTILFIYLFASFTLILFWRTYGYFVLGSHKLSNAIIIGAGEEMKELLSEVNNNSIYNLKFVSSVDLGRVNQNGFWDEVVERVYTEDVSVIAIDLAHENVEPVLPHLYNLIFSKVDFIDMHKIYEDIFNRVPLSLLKYNWFLENVSATPRTAYDSLKRLMDVSISLVLFVVSVFVYPFVYLAVRLSDGGPVFFVQERVGENNKIIKVVKFRSMSLDGTHVTSVGSLIRRLRIDELPQLWNVLRGDLSLIGPRPEKPDYVKRYNSEIPYYNVRHIIRPGLSGWAQIHHDTHPHHAPDTIETKNKLSYDLYYIKNRSLLLDLKIALRTLKIIVSFAGR